jgi:hypothetical protein
MILSKRERAVVKATQAGVDRELVRQGFPWRDRIIIRLQQRRELRETARSCR